MPQTAYIIASPPGYEALASAEASAICPGSWITPRCVIGDADVDVDRTAFVHYRMELLAQGRSYAEVGDRIAGLGLASEGFRVEVHKHPRRTPMPRESVARDLANLITGRPDLVAPRERFLFWLEDDTMLFGRIEQETANDWKQRMAKPFNVSAGIGSRMAKACVNLVCRPGDRMLDPCCGAGTIPIEAALVGVRAFAFDLSWRMAHGAAANARHYGLDIGVGIGDVRSLAGRFDAVVSNLPYGIAIHHSPRFYDEALANIVRLAPRCALISNREVIDVAERNGLRVDRVIRQGESDGKLPRFVHLLSRARANPPGGDAS